MGRLGRQRVRRDDLGSEELVRWTPLGVPQSDPKMAAKIDEKTLENQYDFFGDFQGPLGEALGLQNCIFLVPITFKISMIFPCDFGDFWAP